MSEFVDEVAACVKGGDGGAGSVSFRREAHTPKGGPDGGDGGKGGDVWFVADNNVSSLLAFRDHPHRTAKNGTHGKGKKQHGHAGEDLVVPVPVGTVVKDRDGTVIADLTSAGDRWLAAPGGIGGKGNAKFLSNRMRAPSFAEQGEHCVEQWIQLELKLMADVALVGFPNAGKSTFISVVSAAKPKIANYPFTTLAPNLGVVRFDNSDLVIADIPGLIEGAADGRGLGHKFLRHIERSRVLAVMLDGDSVEGLSTDEQEKVLLGELGRYRAELLDRPRIRIITKSDAFESNPDDIEPGTFLISSITRQGVDEVLNECRRLVSGARRAEPVEDGYVVHRPVPMGVSVQRVDDGFEVLGQDALRAVALSDLTNPDALAYAQRRLKELGVDKALARAGAKEGDSVTIGELTFDYSSADQIHEGGGR